MTTEAGVMTSPDAIAVIWMESLGGFASFGGVRVELWERPIIPGLRFEALEYRPATEQFRRRHLGEWRDLDEGERAVVRLWLESACRRARDCFSPWSGVDRRNGHGSGRLRVVVGVLLVAIGLWAGKALALDISGGNFILSDEERATCALEGGCAVFTMHRVAQMLIEAARIARAGCGSGT